MKPIKYIKKIIPLMILSIIFLCSCAEQSDSSSGFKNKKDVVDNAANNMVVDGISISAPFSLDDLGDDFTFDTNTYFSQTADGEYYMLGYLCHNDTRICDVQLYNLTPEYEDNDELLRAKKINYIGSTSIYSAVIEFDGVKVGDDISAVEKWGEPTEQKENFMRFSRLDDAKLNGTLTIYYNREGEGVIDSILYLDRSDDPDSSDADAESNTVTDAESDSSSDDESSGS